MPDKKSNERLDNLRERLYARGESSLLERRTSLKGSASTKMVDTIEPVRPQSAATAKSVTPPPPSDINHSEPEDEGSPRRNHKLRFILIIIGASFFLLSIVVSSLYIMLGGNSVSGANIALGVTGPFTVGGGEEIALQVGITNQNNIAIESATLVVEYPSGTRSADEEAKELFSERIPLDSGIAPGETMNIPIEARVFGEENQESLIRISIEYRVTGSSATFYKEAAPHRFKIGSAPVTLQIDAEKTISSGQETTVHLTISSNSPNPISNLVVRAEYPRGFDFVSSSPAPVSGRNVWSISELKPEEEVTIDINGVVTGTQSEKYVIRFTTGISDGRSQELASVLAVGDVEFTLEDPFLDVEVQVANQTSDTVSVGSGEQVTVSLELRNTLDTTVYDGLLEVKLSGNALSDSNVSVNNGYYDSNTNTVRFDVSSVSSLRQIDPGSTAQLSFTVRPETSGISTPQLNLDVSAAARRVSRSSARETIAGTISKTIRVESQPTIEAVLLDSEDGPEPPVAGETTSYNIRWRIVNSANDISSSVVTASLPTYVEWADDTSGSGAWSYNSSTRTIEWQAGSINAGDETSGTFQVNILPSSSLVGRTPTLVESISMRSTDDFTGSILRHSTGVVTTELSGQRNSGVVQSN